MGEGAAFVLFVALQRLAEVAYARRNEARLRARGAVEHGAAHYPAIVAVHAAWLAALAAFGWSAEVAPGWLALYAAIFALRIWTLASLGSRWSARVLTLPGEAPVRRGPYRWLRHPNYAVVVAEIAVAPLVLGLPWVALVFTVLNALVLRVRLRTETRAWGGPA